MIWSRGRVLPAGGLSIRADDRTFAHGLGLFETLRTWRGRAPLLDRHLARLRASAADWGIPIDPADLPDRAAVAALMADDGADSLLRITLSGGLSESGGSTLWMSAGPISPPTWSGAATVARGLDGSSHPHPRLNRSKSINYLARRLLFDAARALGVDEGLIEGESGAIEGSRTSLFAVRRGVVRTPSAATCPIVPGVMRGLVVELARSGGWAVEEVGPGVDVLDGADEVFLTNSTRGIIPVGGIVGAADGSVRAFEAPGPATRAMGAEVDRFVGGWAET